VLSSAAAHAVEDGHHAAQVVRQEVIGDRGAADDFGLIFGISFALLPVCVPKTLFFVANAHGILSQSRAMLIFFPIPVAEPINEETI